MNLKKGFKRFGERFKKLTKEEKEAKAIDPDFFELTQGYMRHGEWVDMSKSRKCTKLLQPNNQTIILGEPRVRKANGAHDFEIEFRATTVRQLRGIFAITKRYAEDGKMVNCQGKVLKLKEVTLYEINTHIGIPFTKITEKSLVESLPSTEGTQPPLWFMSHWWGDPFINTMDCIERFILDFNVPEYEIHREDYGLNGGGFTEDTPIWICAFANRPHNPTSDGFITMDPSQPGFARAMKMAEYRTISILDEKSIAFSRIWFTLEFYLTLILKEKEEIDGMWAVYTSHKYTHIRRNGEEQIRHAVGLISSGKTPYECMSGKAATAREEHFPLDRILAALNIDVEKANSSIEDDKRKILHCITGSTNFEKEPTKNHPNYNKLNEIVRGAFLSSIPVLRHTLSKGDKVWNQVIQAISKSTSSNSMTFDFNSGKGWDKLSSDKAIQLIQNLPKTLEGLEVLNSPYGAEFVESVAKFVATAKNLKALRILYTFAGGSTGGRDCGKLLAEAVADHPKIESLRLLFTDLMGQRNALDWEKALQKNKSLKKLEIYGLGGNFGRSVDLTSFDKETSTIKNIDDSLPRLYWNNDTKFTDALLPKEEIAKLKSNTCAEEKIFKYMNEMTLRRNTM